MRTLRIFFPMKTLGIMSAFILLVTSGAAAQAAGGESPSPGQGAQSVPGTSAPAVPVVTLSQSIDSALAQGDDNKILQRNLEIARAQHALNVSRDSLTLGGSLGYSASTTFGTPGLSQGGAASSLASPQGPQAGASVSGPLTSVTLSASPWIPPAATGGTGTGVFGLSVTQTLWNGYPGGQAKATVDKSLLTLQGQELSADAGRRGIILTVQQAYYTMLNAQRNAALQQQVLDQQNTVLTQIQAIYNLTQASLSDLKLAQLNARTAQVNLDSAANDLRAARLSLATLMGYPPDAQFTAANAEPPQISAATVEDAVAAGLSHRTELKQLALSIKSSGIDLAVARGQATPSVSVSGGVSWVLDYGQGLPNTGSASVGVKVGMPILDAGAVKNQVGAIQGQADVYSLQLAQLQKSITTAITNAWEALRVAREKLDVASASVDVNTLQLKIVTAERDNGAASNNDVLTQAVNLANAAHTLASSRSAADLAALQLLYQMGY